MALVPSGQIAASYGKITYYQGCANDGISAKAVAFVRRQLCRIGQWMLYALYL